MIEKPTLLHLYIKALEKYYAGQTLSASDVHSKIINVTGSPTSMYMKNFWGHDENLMYYVDHEYPLMCKGTGSTADYILLEDGMSIDLGMFTDWNFYKEGAFTYFDPEQKIVEAGQSVTLTMKATATNAADDGESSFAGKAMPGETVRISSDKGKTWQENYAVTDSQGRVNIKFDQPGTYYVSGGTEIRTAAGDNDNADKQGGTIAGTGYTLRTFKNYKFAAPPISVITVTAPVTPEKLATPKLTVSSKTETSVKLTWDSVKEADSYVVYYRKIGSNKWSAKGTDGVTMTLRSLRPSTGYEFKITALAGNNGKMTDSDTSAKVSTATMTPATLGQISKFKAKAYAGKATLTWKYSGGNCSPSGYQVYFSGKKNAGYKKVTTVKTNKATIKKRFSKHRSYYLRIRGYKKVNGVYKYTSWKYLTVRR